MLSYYNPTAERLDYLHSSILKSTLLLGMNITKKIFHITWQGCHASETTFDGFAYENNQWVFGWIRYHHGPNWPNSRAFAR
eukprot:3323373-Pyramimonas_sp.AAC.1